MRHRLPLSGSSVTKNDFRWDGPRTKLPWPAIAIADTERGLAALELALALGEAAHQLHIPVRFRVLDFERAPLLPVEQASRLQAFGPLNTQHVERELAVALDGSALELWVGLPALVALEPTLGILVGVDRPRLEWPPLLRGVSVTLALAAVRAGLAGALLQELNQRGFLPAVGEVVR